MLLRTATRSVRDTMGPGLNKMRMEASTKAPSSGLATRRTTSTNGIQICGMTRKTTSMPKSTSTNREFKAGCSGTSRPRLPLNGICSDSLPPVSSHLWPDGNRIPSVLDHLLFWHSFPPLPAGGLKSFLRSLRWKKIGWFTFEEQRCLYIFPGLFCRVLPFGDYQPFHNQAPEQS